MFAEDVSALVTCSETNKLFEVRKDAKQLSEKKGEMWHLVVSKLLFIMNSSRPDLEIVVIFFMTMVLKSDIDDWNNWEGY